MVSRFNPGLQYWIRISHNLPSPNWNRGYTVLTILSGKSIRGDRELSKLSIWLRILVHTSLRCIHHGPTHHPSHEQSSYLLTMRSRQLDPRATNPIPMHWSSLPRLYTTHVTNLILRINSGKKPRNLHTRYRSFHYVLISKWRVFNRFNNQTHLCLTSNPCCNSNLNNGRTHNGITPNWKFR